MAGVLDSLRVLDLTWGGQQVDASTLDAAGVPCEISSSTFSQHLFDDPDLLERGWVVHREGSPALSAIDMLGIGIDFSATPSKAGGAPAIPRQHTREVDG